MSAQLTRRRALASMAASGAAAAMLDRSAAESRAACCYFAAKDKDVNQPAQKAFIDWNPAQRREAFTVQPKFEGNAEDFGMVIPTPTQPKLDEMPRDFFRMLAVFTILEPMPLDKYKAFPRRRLFAAGPSRSRAKKKVVVLEEGVVGSLDYKIVKADDAQVLYDWLDQHGYSYAGDERTLDFYIQKNWVFTVMKIDPKQMKRRPDGTYQGNVTPTRFAFRSEQLIYPLRITRLSVKEFTEALFYVQAPDKIDLPDSLSYQFSWQSMWAQAMGFAIKRTEAEERWLQHIEPHLAGYRKMVVELRRDGLQPTTLEWAKKIVKLDLDVIDGREKFNREAPAAEVQKLKLLRGHVKQDQVITKFRKVFHKREMADDLVMARATAAGAPDDTSYYQILPTSPP